jgi:hypothetical protein
MPAAGPNRARSTPTYDGRKLEKIQDGAIAMAAKALWKILELAFGVKVTK